MNGRTLLRDTGIIALVFVVGYGVATFMLSPAPLGETARVAPRLLELPAEAARARLAKTGLRAKVVDERPDPEAPSGTIIWQDPVAGTELPPGATVELIASSGRASVPMPDVVGFETAQAVEVLRAAGLRVGEIDTVGASTAATGDGGVVLATRPAVGQPREAGSAVGLVVSAEPAR